MTTMSQSSKTLTFEDAVEVWRLRRQGWFQHRIAAQFDVNQGRVNDVLKERVHAGSREAASRDGFGSA